MPLIGARVSLLHLLPTQPITFLAHCTAHCTNCFDRSFVFIDSCILYTVFVDSLIHPSSYPSMIHAFISFIHPSIHPSIHSELVLISLPPSLQIPFIHTSITSILTASDFFISTEQSSTHLISSSTLFHTSSIPLPSYTLHLLPYQFIHLPAFPRGEFAVSTRQVRWNHRLQRL